MQEREGGAAMDTDPGGAPDPGAAAAGAAAAGAPPDLVAATLEVRLRPGSAAGEGAVRDAVGRLVQRAGLDTAPYWEPPAGGAPGRYVPGPLRVEPGRDAFLEQHVEAITVAGLDAAQAPGLLLFWQLDLEIVVYQLRSVEPLEEVEGDEDIASFWEWEVPSLEFDGLWASLHFDSAIKRRLLAYARSALFFSTKGVDAKLVSWNRVVLLYGPPGTGKTTLCKGLAQRLAIQLRNTYPQAYLLEVNAHSLFSKWFSESGKLVSKLFGKIQDMVEDGHLIFVLLDEVESLTAARQAAVSGNEPSDAIRAVNALLTHLDALKHHPNVMVMATSNISQAIDVAFLDRADIKAYIGPPSAAARYAILRSGVNELARAGVLDAPVGPRPAADPATEGGAGAAGLAAPTAEALLREVCEGSEGISGRSLRKLPFLAHAAQGLRGKCTTRGLLAGMHEAARQILAEQETLGQ